MLESSIDIRCHFAPPFDCFSLFLRPSGGFTFYHLSLMPSPVAGESAMRSQCIDPAQKQRLRNEATRRDDASDVSNVATPTLYT